MESVDWEGERPLEQAMRFQSQRRLLRTKDGLPGGVVGGQGRPCLLQDRTRRLSIPCSAIALEQARDPHPNVLRLFPSGGLRSSGSRPSLERSCGAALEIRP